MSPLLGEWHDFALCISSIFFLVETRKSEVVLKHGSFLVLLCVVIGSLDISLAALFIQGMHSRKTAGSSGDVQRRGHGIKEGL